MSGRIKVVLLEDVAALGQAGEVVSVSEGYARNALFPEGKAALATENIQRRQSEQAAIHQAKEKAGLAALQATAEKLDGTELAIGARVKKEDRLFGHISAKQIASELNAQAGLQIKPSAIVMKESIQKIGSYPVTVRLSPEVEFDVQVTVTAAPGTKGSAKSEPEEG